ncbi:MAG: peptidoglycan DD-metalloendopeptidase family protein [Mesorhizobium sp.]
MTTHGIDATFRLRREAAAARRRRARWRKAGAGLLAAALAVAGLAVYLTRDQWSFGDTDEELHAVEEAAEMPDDAPVYVPAIVDLAGDPMWITMSREAASKGRSVVRPAALAGESGISPRIQLLADAMLSTSERFMTTIPSSQEDFAFFQAQRAAAVPPAAPQEGAAPDLQPGAAVDAGGEAAGWGEAISDGEAAVPEVAKTTVENNTTVAVVRPEFERFASTEDQFLKILTERSLESVLLEQHFGADDARLADTAMKATFGREVLEPGYVVAMRGFRARREELEPRLMQVSVYARNTFVGTLARNPAGGFESAADPWVREDLFNYSGTPDEGPHKRQYRLLDAIYSTAARNNVPTGVIGEAIMMLSRGQDLNAFATVSDRLVLIYSDTPRGKDGVSGRVLYVGVKGAEKTLECFVYQQGDGEFACVSRDDQVHSLTVANGMVTPVNGVMTSTFGPRMHPVEKVIRNHEGVDWAAPVGTPIFAAFDGKIVFQGEAGTYGNLVRIAHPDGRETRYAHMQRFAMASGVGTEVRAGDVIGYVGTTGRSTGPHLHFEVIMAGQPIDPLGTVTVVASDGSAVEKLTERIIHVESGGRATAKNPLSSATGLGQFIDSTWIRMVATYRPELARSLSRAELLALRFDPTLSREMVRNLAREGEAYLRARGHQITAGRLYLCHFLGAEGANTVLSAPSSAMLAEVLGAGVIRANPFLTGKSAGYVIDWAERKMNRRAPPSTAQPTVVTREVRQTSPEFEAYKKAIAELVGAV